MELQNTVDNLSKLSDLVRSLEEQLAKVHQDLSQAKEDLTVEAARSGKFQEDLQEAHSELDRMQSSYGSLLTRN